MNRTLTTFEIRATNILIVMLLLGNIDFLYGICIFIALLCLALLFLSSLRRNNWLPALACVLMTIWILAP